ncbi:MAG: hypothetical protein HOW73_41520 [Polyangiaceae bacterium]|nr:hypothetical protein [Polyangiaceae bacterium]
MSGTNDGSKGPRADRSGKPPIAPAPRAPAIPRPGSRPDAAPAPPAPKAPALPLAATTTPIPDAPVSAQKRELARQKESITKTILGVEPETRRTIAGAGPTSQPAPPVEREKEKALPALPKPRPRAPSRPSLPDTPTRRAFDSVDEGWDTDEVAAAPVAPAKTTSTPEPPPVVAAKTAVETPKPAPTAPTKITPQAEPAPIVPTVSEISVPIILDLDPIAPAEAKVIAPEPAPVPLLAPPSLEQLRPPVEEEKKLPVAPSPLSSGRISTPPWKDTKQRNRNIALGVAGVGLFGIGIFLGRATVDVPTAGAVVSAVPSTPAPTPPEPVATVASAPVVVSASASASTKPSKKKKAGGKAKATSEPKKKPEGAESPPPAGDQAAPTPEGGAP